jgi:hypothetical protein
VGKTGDARSILVFSARSIIQSRAGSCTSPTGFPPSAAPLKGGDSIAILREIGYDDGAIDDMVRLKATIDGRRRQPEE